MPELPPPPVGEVEIVVVHPPRLAPLPHLPHQPLHLAAIGHQRLQHHPPQQQPQAGRHQQFHQ